MSLPITVRPEEPNDVDGVRVVNERAFGQPDEARLVDALRAVPGIISLVAVAADGVIGHIFFSPVEVEGTGATSAMAGLAPMAVAPEHQRRGAGSALVRAGLEACRSHGYGSVVVVGHPEYYPRFGFVPAHTRGLRYDDRVPREAFMVLELRPHALDGCAGAVRYRPEFSAE